MARQDFSPGILLKSLCPSTLAVVFLGLFVQAWAAPEAAGGISSTSGQGIIAGLRTRVAWVQDVGEGSDPFAKRGNLRLMGLDTADEAVRGPYWGLLGIMQSL